MKPPEQKTPNWAKLAARRYRETHRVSNPYLEVMSTLSPAEQEKVLAEVVAPFRWVHHRVREGYRRIRVLFL